MNTEITEILQQYGLTDKETAVYLACLELGASRVTTIAKKAKILRESCYFILNGLIDKGLANYVIISNTKHFSAAKPQKLIEILQEKEAKIKSILPDLISLDTLKAETSTAQVYEGKDGVKTIIDDLTLTKEPIYTFSSYKSLFGKLTYYFPHYITKRIEEKIPIQVLTERVPETEQLLINGEKEFREVRFIPKGHEFLNAIFMYGNKIAILDLENNMTGVLIENKDMYQTFRKIFDLYWSIAEKK